MEITQSTEFSQKLFSAVNHLLPQLSGHISPLTEGQFKKIVETESTPFFIAREEDVILGCLTLILVQIPSGLQVVIEDVIVDEKARGKGVGHKLTEAAIEYARQQGATNVNLTSNPAREAANALYQKMGFKRRHTNVYRLTL